ncbi:hypothetical protein [Vibrio atlanticus]|uniref:Uncharacterized protein n=1 Tax=Vibrio atlanticus TaxID=693153 RepID=A0A1C3IKB0_9VIBR|nr:hypothetical protein [Vibrio atlanticus]SBS61871.1 hypothetical protein VAT7223_00875 [Vibrio atlanticus]
MIDSYEILVTSFITSIPIIAVALIFYFLFKNAFHSYIKMKSYESDKYRLDLESEIYKLNKKISSTEERFNSANKLIIEGNTKSSIAGTDFLERIGADKNMSIKDKSVFVLTPLNPDFNEDFEWVENAFRKHKYVCSKGNDVKVQSNLLSHIIKEMLASKFVVANIGGRNPNVFYELGIAHALGKDVILISRSVDDITFDLSSSQIIIFNTEEQLSSSIDEWLVSTLESKIS